MCTCVDNGLHAFRGLALGRCWWSWGYRARGNKVHRGDVRGGVRANKGAVDGKGTGQGEGEAKADLPPPPQLSLPKPSHTPYPITPNPPSLSTNQCHLPFGSALTTDIKRKIITQTGGQQSLRGRRLGVVGSLPKSPLTSQPGKGSIASGASTQGGCKVEVLREGFRY